MADPQVTQDMVLRKYRLRLGMTSAGRSRAFRLQLQHSSKNRINKLGLRPSRLQSFVKEGRRACPDHFVHGHAIMRGLKAGEPSAALPSVVVQNGFWAIYSFILFAPVQSWASGNYDTLEIPKGFDLSSSPQIFTNTTMPI